MPLQSIYYFRTRINELRNLQYLPRLSEARETMFEDRTKAHADHVGHGHERMTTAAVGMNLSETPFTVLLVKLYNSSQVFSKRYNVAILISKIE